MRFREKISKLSLFAAILLSFVSCDEPRPQPIHIGFVGGLTGRTAAVGIAARDGALLAIDEVNRAGGIDGRNVELIVKDIQQDGVAGLNAVQELLQENVPAIIGPMTSTMALVLAPMVNNTETIMVSPTAATQLLGQKDDNFLRLRPQCSIVAKTLADYVFDEKKTRRISIIYDVGNSAYTSDWKECFAERLVAKGGEIVSSVAFDSSSSHRFDALIRQALAAKPSGLLVLANSLDAAMFTQQLAKQQVKLPVYASEWSMTRDLLSSGGRSVEGMTLFHVFNESSKKQKYLDFKKRYKARFKQEPSFPTIHAYDATQIVLNGLKDGARTGPELKKNILQQDLFDTLQSTISFDQYGDVKRELFLTVVKDGEFVVIQ